MIATGQVLISSIILTGSLDALLVADSRRVCVLCCLISGAPCYVGPNPFSTIGALTFYVQSNLPIDILYRRYGQLVTNAWYATGAAGTVLNVTEIVL